MSNDESSDHHWVVAERVKLGIGEGEDDGENRTANIAEEEGQERGNLPVLANANNQVEITTQLVALIIG